MPPQEPVSPPTPVFQPGQTVIFLGDHTAPDDPGYVGVISDVLTRFHPELKLNLISAGARGQTAAALGSTALLDLLSSSRPDWLCIGLGWADTVKEPSVQAAAIAGSQQSSVSEEDEDDVLGDEGGARSAQVAAASGMDQEVEPQLTRLAEFRSDMAASVHRLGEAGISCILLTTVIAGKDLRSPVNASLRAYSKAIREVAAGEQVVVVDVERAFRDVLIRAASYKQSVGLASEQGQITPQGQALIARTFLNAFGVLPYPGFRPSK